MKFKYNFFVLTDKREKLYNILLTDSIEEAENMLKLRIFPESDVDLVKWPAMADFWNVNITQSGKPVANLVLYRLVTNERLIISV